MMHLAILGNFFFGDLTMEGICSQPFHKIEPWIMNLRTITIVFNKFKKHEIFIPEMDTKDFQSHNINKT